MSIWVLSDLHLALADPSKRMDKFPGWKEYDSKIKKAWERSIQKEDLVLIAGDISWAIKLDDALTDLCWIDSLPGTKLISEGNHDYWWQSRSKMEKFCEDQQLKTIRFLFKEPFTWKNVQIAGNRLWDTEAYGFNEYIEWHENPGGKNVDKDPEQLKAFLEKKRETDRKIFEKGLAALDATLSQVSKNPEIYRIAMLHYPPIGADLHPSEASALLEKHQIDLAIFGHLHSVKKGALPFGTARGVKYLLTSADYLDFKPFKLLDDANHPIN